MGSCRIIEVRTGAGERVDGMVNWTSLASGSITGLRASEGGRITGWRLVSTMSWRRLGGFQKVTEGDLVRRSWVDGSMERIWKPSLKICLRQ